MSCVCKWSINRSKHPNPVYSYSITEQYYNCRVLVRLLRKQQNLTTVQFVGLAGVYRTQNAVKKLQLNTGNKSVPVKGY
jgi:hypothetical protein